MNRLANLRDTQLRRLAMVFLVLVAVAGCGVKGPAQGGGQGGAQEEGPFGPPDQSALLAPLAGTWVLDVDKTLEDRYDPGDMSKCYARMKLDGNVLYFEVKMKDGLPDVNDPDLLSSPLPAEGGSAATCDADAPAGSDWSEWSTTVFTRKP